MAALFSSTPVSCDSEPGAAKRNSSVINFIIYTCAFHTVACVKKAYLMCYCTVSTQPLSHRQDEWFFSIQMHCSKRFEFSKQGQVVHVYRGIKCSMYIKIFVSVYCLWFVHNSFSGLKTGLQMQS